MVRAQRYIRRRQHLHSYKGDAVRILRARLHSMTREDGERERGSMGSTIQLSCLWQSWYD